MLQHAECLVHLRHDSVRARVELHAAASLKTTGEGITGGEAFVYNGLDPAEFTFRRDKADYDLFLGRLHRVKGYRWAIAGARRARRRLVLAGGWRPSLRPSIRYVGQVGGTRKAELLAGARCLWMPALWNEPFGITSLVPYTSVGMTSACDAMARTNGPFLNGRR